MSHWTLNGLELSACNIPKGPVDVNFYFVPGLMYRGHACAELFKEETMLDILVDHPLQKYNVDQDAIQMHYVVYHPSIDAFTVTLDDNIRVYRMRFPGCTMSDVELIPDGSYKMDAGGILLYCCEYRNVVESSRTGVLFRGSVPDWF
jgi:hypothetical protein